MSDDQSREIFREEAFELLSELESTLLELEGQPGNAELVNRAFRALHTIKGSGAMFGFDDIAEFTHDVESLFDRVRNEEIPVTKDIISVAFAARDHILGLLRGPDEQGNGTPECSARVLGQVRVLMAGPQPAEVLPVESASPAAPSLEPEQLQEKLEHFRVRITPRDPVVGKTLDLEPLFRSMRNLGDCEISLDRKQLPELGDLDPQTLYLAWEARLSTTSGQGAIRDLFFFADIDFDLDIQQVASAEELNPAPAQCPVAPVPPAPPVKKLGEILVEEGAILKEDLEHALKQQKPIGKILTESGLVTEQQVQQAVAKQQALAPDARQPQAQKEAGSSLRVAAEKLDILVDLVGELVIVQAQISQMVSQRGDPMLTSLSEQLERLSDELRDSTLGIRMLPIGTTFSKFKRLVRDLSSELGKEIELVTRGEETELDKTVIERLGDPLVHLLRNSIDHGIEMPSDREAAGKKTHGVILLEAEHSGNEVLIRITDDGKGMDPEVFRKKGIEKGLIAPDADISDKEALQLIFLPGFSTAKQVTNISGRGVGMDVVHRAIDSLRGSIDITSAKGQGSTITIRLPLTLAIIEGLQVKVGEGFFVVPLSLVEECVELHGKDVDRTRSQQIINLRGELVPYIQLRQWFQVEGEPPSIEQIVITGVEGKRIGVVVDHVIGEHQTVIKSLGRVYRDVEGISGATIRGDGTLALILDVPRLVRAVAAEAEV